MKKLRVTFSMCLMGLWLLWNADMPLAQAAQEESGTISVKSSVPTKEEWAAWEEDGTLQQRIDFMKAIEQEQTAEGLIARWNQSETLSLNSPEWWHGGMPTEGDVKALVFMVEFADMKNTNTQVTVEYMQETFFGAQNKEAVMYPHESLTAFYQRSSYDKLNISGDVYGWYTLSENRSAYENDWEGREKLIKELLDAYDEQIDFSDYDADGDGNIDAIYIHYAGGNTGWGSQWWSYMSSTVTEITYDETDVYRYVFLSDTDSVTAIHETGHLLGLPDYYNAAGLESNNEKGGIGICDMMDHNIGDHNIFSKMLLGWVEPYIVTDTSEVTLELLSSSEAKAVIVAKEDISSIFEEYYILELYNNSGNNVHSARRWAQEPETDTPLVKIYHVDAALNEDGTDFKYDNYSTEHKLIKLLESDGKELSGLLDCEVVSSKFYDEGMSLGPNTLPSSEWYGGLYSGIEITVKDITNQNASVQITMGIEDAVAPDVQPDALSMSNSVFNIVPIGTNSMRIMFDCYIYEGDNFAGITLLNSATGANLSITYDILNPRGDYPETVNRYHMLELIFSDALSYDTEYVLTIPADAVRDAAGNGNTEIKLSFRSAPQQRSYVVATEDLGFDVLPEGTPDGVETVPGYDKEIYYMENGNIIVTYTLTEGHSGIKVYGPDKQVLSNTYSEARLTAGTLYKLGEEYYFLDAGYGYVILNVDGKVIKLGSYTESGYSGTISTDSVLREDCLDIRLRSPECTTSLVGYFICRVDEHLEISYLYPDIDGTELVQYNKDYTYREWPKPDQYSDFADVNYHEDTQYYHGGFVVSGLLTDKYTYSNSYHNSSALGFSNIWDSEGGLEICDDRNRKYVECNTSYGYNMNGLINVDYVGDGYVISNDVYSLLSSPTLNGSCTYLYHPEGRQITRLDEELNVLWTTYIPVDVDNNQAGSPIKMGDTIYLTQGSVTLAIDDTVAATWISADKGFSFAETVGTVDEEKQTILVAPGTTVQNIADKVQGSYGSITFYNASYEEITNWSEVIHNGIMCVTSVNGFYDYYYQITDIEEITLGTDYVELVQNYGENTTYDYTSANMITASEDEVFLYVESTNGGISDGHIFTYDGRSLSISTNAVGEATLTVKNVFGDAEAECVVKVYPSGTILTTGIELETSSLSLTIGESEALVAKVLPLNATDQTVTWSSTDEAVATVSTTGEVTAVGAGEAEIAVTTTNGKKAVCAVTVAEAAKGYTLGGTLKCFGDEAEQTSIVLLDASGNQVSAATVSGLSTEYSFENVAEGSYTVRISKLNHVTRDYSISVEGEAVSVDVELRLLGDVSGDGKLSFLDKKKYFDYLQGLATWDEYLLEVGDVNDDGKISFLDKKKIFDHIEEKTLLW